MCMQNDQFTLGPIRGTILASFLATLAISNDHII